MSFFYPFLDSSFADLSSLVARSVCFFNTIPLVIVAAAANLTVLSGFVQFLKDWEAAGEWGNWTFSAVAGKSSSVFFRLDATDSSFRVDRYPSSCGLWDFRSASTLPHQEAHEVSRSRSSSFFPQLSTRLVANFFCLRRSGLEIPG